MQTFDSFHRVFQFCLQTHMDSDYVARIDSDLNSGNASKDIKQLIQEVKSFHNIRLKLCNVIKSNLNNVPILSALHQARGLKQYNSVPVKSACAICDQTLTKNQGILLILDGVHPYTVHSRYKVILYNFWMLVHFPDEIVKSCKSSESNKTIQVPKHIRTIAERVEYLSNVENKKRSKQLYLKLKSIAQYIQTEFPTIPINQSCSS